MDDFELVREEFVEDIASSQTGKKFAKDAMLEQFLKDARQYPILSREQEVVAAREIEHAELDYLQMLVRSATGKNNFSEYETVILAIYIAIRRFFRDYFDHYQHIIPREHVPCAALVDEGAQLLADNYERTACPPEFYANLHASFESFAKHGKYYSPRLWHINGDASVPDVECENLLLRAELLTIDESLLDIAQKQLVAARRVLVHHNLRLVIHIALKYPGELSLIDRIQEGNIGLIKAAERFEYQCGTKFITFAHGWIRQAVLRGIDKTAQVIRHPTYLRELGRSVQRIKKDFFAAYDRMPTPEELAQRNHTTEERIDIVQQGKMVSLHHPIRFGKSQVELEKTLIDPEVDIEKSYAELEFKQQMRALIENLSGKREKYIIRERFGIDTEPKTLQQIAQELRLSRERVRQIEHLAIARLKYFAMKNGIAREFLVASNGS